MVDRSFFIFNFDKNAIVSFVKKEEEEEAQL